MSQIKITSFKRLDNSNQKIETKPLFTPKNKLKPNVLFYNDQENLKAKQLENWIKQELKQKINFLKIVQEKSIPNTIQTLINQKKQKTLFISTKLLTQQIKDLFGYDIKDSFQRINFILFQNQLEKAPPIIFHLKNLSLITNEPQKIKQILTQQVKILLSQNQQNQVSSLNSQDQQNFENQFQKVSPVFNLHKANINQEQKNQQIVFNDNPGVGNYETSINNYKFKGTNRGTFSKQKR